MTSKKYKIDQKILSSDSPFLISLGSQDRVKLGTHEHLVLLALCEQPGTLLDKETLIEKGWPGKFVTDSSLTQAIRNIRSHLNDNGKSQKHIKTIAKKGYLIEKDYVQSLEVIDDKNINETESIRKLVTLTKRNILLISIILQLAFIIYVAYSYTSIFVSSTAKDDYPSLSFQQDYVYIFSSDFQLSEELGVALINALSAKEIVPERLYVMLNDKTISFSFISKNKKSKNRVLSTEKKLNYKHISEYIVNEIEY
ncbi:type III secretion system transcriptional regulator VtrA [Vibrio parahaemolyticus]|uniref:winged helix-turn-helix domain-containing protein n=1 Tax=Vibrio parahaemolyticus TaxID=670 RepID=UPI00193D2B0A|nr:transcriptional regulator [Vibrio parahaemolyticus]EIK4811166.1 type III secretion system transcriptional regulator VtrA [Vibrio parahaemolyticus]EJG1997997.1 type III secretion system transcriptional regulator VtrA [Vibrio parahaemolyticus]MBM4959779.1 winged helix-turn-helix domain-containing protein [Vibrio parahaemolyticus]MBM5096372.1 winged helix-turn-helix domain-containing protein [Vibrio parahaemolyticus]